MMFSFQAAQSLLSTCQYVMMQTQRTLTNDMPVADSQLAPGDGCTVAWELNDLRPIPRPDVNNGQEQEQQEEVTVKLVDVFFTVNKYADGHDIVVMFDAAVCHQDGIEELVRSWRSAWRALLLESATIPD